MNQVRSLIKGTPMRTPIHSRPYLNSFPSAHQTPVPDYYQHGILQAQAEQNQMDGQIYGTTIILSKVLSQIQRFILQFQTVHIVDDECVSQKIYRTQLNDIQLLQQQKKYIFDIDGRHIRQFDKGLYMQLVYFPAQMISCFDSVIKELYNKFFIEPETMDQSIKIKNQRKHGLMVGIKHLYDEEKTCVKDLGPKNIGKLVLLQGIVIRTSEVYPEMKRAHFICTVCKSQIDIDLQNARVQQPTNCSNCNSRESHQIIHNLCQFTDKQYIKFQQLPELVAEGATPSSLSVIAYDSNVDGFRPGDRVEVIGIYRTHPVRIQRNKNNLRTVFDTYVDLISFNLLEENKFRIQEKRAIFSDQEKRVFLRMSESQTVLDDLVNSFSPSIFGQEEIKKGILTQLFGGTQKDFMKTGRGKIRSDINICLLGDPSTAKSQLLQQVNKIAPRSIYTSGRGSSAVGLTANVRKDPQTHEFVLESGALVLSDLGICCIDEFDKMDENSRTILLQAMQQQTISIAKAGIVCQLNSRTAILAAANPVDSKYDMKKSIIQNINLPPTLLSRFDLIFIMLDIPNQINDKKLAMHILDFYSTKVSTSINQGKYTPQLLAKYISYARQYIKPIINQQAGKRLQTAYIDMRKKGLGSRTISATPRQLESLIRMSQAFAKMKLSQQVTVDDVEEAIRLIEKATLSAATDPSTGIINMDIINTGRSESNRRRVEELAEKIKQTLMANQAKYRKSTYLDHFIEEFNRFGLNHKMQSTKNEFQEAFRKLQSDDLLALFGQSKVNPQFKLQNITTL